MYANWDPADCIYCMCLRIALAGSQWLTTSTSSSSSTSGTRVASTARTSRTTACTAASTSSHPLATGMTELLLSLQGISVKPCDGPLCPVAHARAATSVIVMCLECIVFLLALALCSGPLIVNALLRIVSEFPSARPRVSLPERLSVCAEC